MNERIENLLHQSGLTAHGCWDKFDEYDKQALAKFAELIVKECVEIALEQKKWVEDQIVCNPRDKEWNLARIQQSQRIVDKIKKHFGVKE